MHRISVAGHFCVDLVPQLPSGARLEPGQLIEVGALGARLGGCVANTGLCLHDLGAPVELQGTVGDDWLGVLAGRLLAEASDGRWNPVVVPERDTSYSLVLEPGGADRTFWHHTGVNATFQAGGVRIDTDLLHVGYPPLLPSVLVDDAAPMVALFERARAGNVTTSLDLAVVDPDSAVGALDWSCLLDRMLSVTDIVSPSVDDCRSMLALAEPASLGLAGELAGNLLDRGAGVALVTAGEHGLVLRTADEARLRRGGRVLAAIAADWADSWLVVPAATLGDRVTSSGAGDAASAGLLYGLAAGLDPQQAAGLAIDTSSHVMRGERPRSPVGTP